MARLDWEGAFRFNAAGPFIYIVFFVLFVELTVRLFRPSFRFNWPNWLVSGWRGAIVVALFTHWAYRMKNCC